MPETLASNTAKPAPSTKVPRVSKKKPEYTGSRWAGLALFIATLLISLLLYLKGQMNSGTLDISSPKINFDFSGLELPSFFGPAEYKLEK